MKKLLILCILLIPYSLSLTPISAQTHEIDSLRQVLKSEKKDTNKVNTLLMLIRNIGNTGVHDSSLLKYGDSILILANEFGIEKGRAAAIGLKGFWYYLQDNIPDATKNLQEALSISQKIGDKEQISYGFMLLGMLSNKEGDYIKAQEYLQKSLSLSFETGEKHVQYISSLYIGGIYEIKGNYPKALEYFFKSLRLTQKMGDESGFAWSLESIGAIYTHQGNYAKALEYYLKALDIFKEKGVKDGISFTWWRMGINSIEQGDYNKGLEYLNKASDLDREQGFKIREVSDIVYIGEIYSKQKNYEKALDYEYKALALSRELGDKREYYGSLSDIGYVNIKQKKYADAKKYLDSALLGFKTIQDKELIKDVYNRLTELDSAKGDYKAELQDNKNYNIYRDSLNNQKTIQAEMDYEYDRKTDSVKARQDETDAIKADESQKQRVIRNSFIGGFFITFIAAGLFFFQRRRIAKEKKRSDELLLNILPEETAEELKETGESKAKSFDMVTVIFTDFKDFTRISEKLSSTELVAELNYLFQAFDTITQKNNLEKIKTIGDSYVAAGGLPVANQTHAKDAINAAIEILQFLVKHNTRRATNGKPVFEARIGINTGPVVAGIVGIKKFSYDIWGDTVNIASRMESSGEEGKINISGSTYQLVKNDFTYTYLGKVQAKNKGEVDMYFVNEKG